MISISVRLFSIFQDAYSNLLLDSVEAPKASTVDIVCKISSLVRRAGRCQKSAPLRACGRSWAGATDAFGAATVGRRR